MGGGTFTFEESIDIPDYVVTTKIIKALRIIALSGIILFLQHGLIA
jgi:hypothetical protein